VYNCNSWRRVKWLARSRRVRLSEREKGAGNVGCNDDAALVRRSAGLAEGGRRLSQKWSKCGRAHCLVLGEGDRLEEVPPVADFPPRKGRASEV